jgi:hypothetical protein
LPTPTLAKPMTEGPRPLTAEDVIRRIAAECTFIAVLWPGRDPEGKVNMATQDEIGQEKQTVSERLARLDHERLLSEFPQLGCNSVKQSFGHVASPTPYSGGHRSGKRARRHLRPAGETQSEAARVNCRTLRQGRNDGRVLTLGSPRQLRGGYYGLRLVLSARGEAGPRRNPIPGLSWQARRMLRFQASM